MTTSHDGALPGAFAGRIAVVTGGSAGLGLGIARSLGDAGARVAIWSRGQARLAGATAELAESGIEALGISCDVRDESAVEKAMAATLDAYGRVDVVVANAGFSSRVPFLDVGLSDWNDVLATNLTGAFLAFRAGARDMVARGEAGALLAISSLAARGGYARMGSYCAAKAGLVGLVQSLAVELAPRHIRCNALLPGFTVNSYFSPDSVAELRGHAIGAAIPAARWGSPEDIGRAALYLADPALPYHTGASVVVDGGLALMPPEDAALAALRRPHTWGERQP